MGSAVCFPVAGEARTVALPPFVFSPDILVCHGQQLDKLEGCLVMAYKHRDPMAQARELLLKSCLFLKLREPSGDLLFYIYGARKRVEKLGEDEEKKGKNEKTRKKRKPKKKEKKREGKPLGTPHSDYTKQGSRS